MFSYKIQKMSPTHERVSNNLRNSVIQEPCYKGIPSTYMALYMSPCKTKKHQSILSVGEKKKKKAPKKAIHGFDMLTNANDPTLCLSLKFVGFFIFIFG